MKKLFSVILRFPLKDKIKILFVGLFFLIALMVSISLGYNAIKVLAETSQLAYPTASTFQGIKKNLGIPKGFLKKELNLSLNLSNKQLLSKEYVLNEASNFKLKRAQFRYYAQDLKKSLFFTLSFFGLFMLVYVSLRNKNSLTPSLKLRMGRFYVPALLFSVLIGGFVLGKSPNPMEALVKGIKVIGGFYPGSFNSIAILILFIIASVIGNKIICGWACPFGALQELLFIFSSKIKKYTLPFYLTNSIRGLIFLFSLFVLFGLIGSSAGFMIYHNINPFNVFVPYFKPVIILFSILIFLVASLFFYRPFCQFVCPFGLVSWILERVSIFKIRIDRDKCVKCKACYKSCPTGAIKSKVVNDRIPKECFSCGRCLDKCPMQAIHYE
ncbi:MAG: 4Fe-4S binding protein [Gammaproteobacteria bacterium]|nr:4Fe-4S binding protein [Gammaproteobacteria bacterium]